MKRFLALTLAVLAVGIGFAAHSGEEKHGQEPPKQFTIHPIGYVRNVDGRTLIEIDKKYQPALLGVDRLSEIWVLWWFDRNDTPQKRSILRVHPRGNPDNPIRGVFATHSPVRPNLIAMTRCKVIAVRENVIEIEGIDAFADTPVIDIKS